MKTMSALAGAQVMSDEVGAILHLIQASTADVRVVGKIGRRVLQPQIARVLAASGYDVDSEDTQGFLPAGLPVWRDKLSHEVVETPGRRRIDLVVRKEGAVQALIEVESDLDDLREEGVSGRSGHYDVFSIARNADGQWFHSYKSLERMAAAAWYATGRHQADLEGLMADAPALHNPLRIGLILVTGSSRARDRRILEPRLRALGAQLFSVKDRS